MKRWVPVVSSDTRNTSSLVDLPDAVRVIGALLAVAGLQGVYGATANAASTSNVERLTLWYSDACAERLEARVVAHLAVVARELRRLDVDVGVAVARVQVQPRRRPHRGGEVQRSSSGFPLRRWFWTAPATRCRC